MVSSHPERRSDGQRHRPAQRPHPRLTARETCVCLAQLLLQLRVTAYRLVQLHLKRKRTLGRARCTRHSFGRHSGGRRIVVARRRNRLDLPRGPKDISAHAPSDTYHGGQTRLVNAVP